MEIVLKGIVAALLGVAIILAVIGIQSLTRGTTIARLKIMLPTRPSLRASILSVVVMSCSADRSGQSSVRRLIPSR